MKTIIDISGITIYGRCIKCKHKWCYTWEICTGRLMEILAYNMIMEGEY